MKNDFSTIIDFIVLPGVTMNKHENICKTTFPVVFCQAFEQTMTVSTIKAGFRACDIYPFNPSAIIKDRVMPSTSTTNTNQPLVDFKTSATTSVQSTFRSGQSTPTSVQSTSTTTTVNITPQQPSGLSTLTSKVPVESPADVPSTSSQQTTCSTPVNTHPLVKTGLIPHHLADILLTPIDEGKKKQEEAK